MRSGVQVGCGDRMGLGWGIRRVRVWGVGVQGVGVRGCRGVVWRFGVWGSRGLTPLVSKRAAKGRVVSKTIKKLITNKCLS